MKHELHGWAPYLLSKCKSKVCPDVSPLKHALFALLMLTFFALSAAASVADVKHYPGAKIDEHATKDAQEAARQAKVSAKAAIYTTKDPFEKVYEFYKGKGREFQMPGHSKAPKLPSGQDLKEAYFILDGAPDLSRSRHWMKIQRPAIGLYKEDVAQKKIRDITVIIVTETK